MTPLNVFSRSAEEIGRLMSNLADTPFTLDGIRYASVESFYVALKFVDPERRAKAASLHGPAARSFGLKSKAVETRYRGETLVLGSDAHHALIKRAIQAKLLEHPAIASAFVATRPRPIVHDTGRREHRRTRLPAEVFCRILTELREALAIPSSA